MRVATADLDNLLGEVGHLGDVDAERLIARPGADLIQERQVRQLVLVYVYTGMGHSRWSAVS
jgi:hypothetical protein